MDILQVIGIGFIAVLLICVLKPVKPEIAVSISIIGVVILFLFISSNVVEVFDVIYELADKSAVNITYINLVVKIIGITYIFQFASSLCKDAGESAISQAVDMCGKVVISIMAIPIFTELFRTISEILQKVG